MVNKINNSNTNINNIKIVVPTPKPKRIYTRRQSSAKSGSEDLESAESKLSKLVNRSMPSGVQPNISVGGHTIMFPSQTPVAPQVSPLRPPSPFDAQPRDDNLMSLAQQEIYPKQESTMFNKQENPLYDLRDPQIKDSRLVLSSSEFDTKKEPYNPKRQYSNNLHNFSDKEIQAARKEILGYETDVSQSGASVSIRKPRGRPVGSKNKPKVPIQTFDLTGIPNPPLNVTPRKPILPPIPQSQIMRSISPSAARAGKLISESNTKKRSSVSSFREKQGGGSARDEP